MKYAVIQSGGKQYKVNEGEEILLDKLLMEEGANYSFPDILLIRDEDKIIIGEPQVLEGKVLGKVLGQEKGDKITVSKFKAKVHYRRSTGFRPLYTRMLIEKISIGKKAKNISAP